MDNPNQTLDATPVRRLDAINDELHIIRRLLSRPMAATAAPEVLDVLRLAVDRVHSLYQQLAFDMRRDAERAAKPTEGAT